MNIDVVVTIMKNVVSDIRYGIGVAWREFGTREPDWRMKEVCLELLDMELARARKSAYGPLVPRPAYQEALWTAECVRRLANEKRWRRLRMIHLKQSWLSLVGYRLSAEGNLITAGLDMARLRAAEVMGLSPRDVQDWDADVLFDAYGGTKLCGEWDYEGTHFRFQWDTGHDVIQPQTVLGGAVLHRKTEEENLRTSIRRLDLYWRGTDTPARTLPLH